MNASLKLDDVSFSKVVLSLRNISVRSSDHAARTMRSAAERIVKRARLYVPEDTEALKNSIRLQESRGARGRLQIDVIAGDQTVVNVKGRMIDLNQYAAIIHEQYSSLEPGQKTQIKRLQNPGVHIGEGFLTRAQEDVGKSLSREVIVGITNIIKTEGMA